MTHLIVPDSIEPYVGYKSLAVISGGTQLCSPQQMEFVWPAQRRAEATCAIPNSYGWELVPEGTETHYPIYDGFAVTAMSTSSSVQIPSFTAPPYDAPEGQAWSWEAMPHKVAERTCSCGIYAVDRPQEGLFGYIAEHHVIVKVALWGTVTRGNKGARGHYAYPQEIIGWTSEHYEQIAETYGIPTNPDPRIQMLIGESVGWHRARARLLALQAGGATFQGGGGVVSTSSKSSASSGFIVRVSAFAALAGGGSIVLSALLHPLVGLAWSLTLCLIWINYCRKHA